MQEPPSALEQTTPPRKRRGLTLEERVGVIHMADAGRSARKIAQQLDVGKTQVSVSGFPVYQGECSRVGTKPITALCFILCSPFAENPEGARPDSQ